MSRFALIRDFAGAQDAGFGMKAIDAMRRIGAMPDSESGIKLVEAARVELASKTVAPSITTSVSPVFFLDAALCRGRLGGRPVRFI